MSIRGVLGSRASIGGVLGSGRGGAAAANGLLTGLVAYWALDEAGGNALDKHSGGLTMTAAASAPGASTGKVYATARTFSGTNQYVYRTSEVALNVGNTSAAWAMWVLRSDASTRVPFSKFGDTPTRCYRIYYDATNGWTFNPSYDGTNAIFFNSGIHGTTGQWDLIFSWLDYPGQKIYVAVNNGTPVSMAYPYGIYTGTVELRIGENANGSADFYGQIGPVAFWKNRTLSAADRTALWNGGAGLAYSAFTA